MLRGSPINLGQLSRNRWQNRLQTVLLLAFLGSYLLLLGWLIWGTALTSWLLVTSVVMLLLAPAGSPHLFMKFSGARRLESWQAPELFSLCEVLGRQAGLTKSPTLYRLPTRLPNALASGTKDDPVIAVSDGLLQLLDQRELAGVLGHELSHLQNGDIRVMRLADLAARLTGTLSLFGLILLIFNLPLVLFSGQGVNWWLVLLLLFAPQVSGLAQLGLSRVREYTADLGAVRLTGDPQGLASALVKIEHYSSGFFRRVLSGYQLPDWLRTHPPTAERVRRLQTLHDLPQEQDLGELFHGRYPKAPAAELRRWFRAPVPIPIRSGQSKQKYRRPERRLW